MRTKITKWYDTENDRVLYGIKVFFDGKWMNVAMEGKPIFCDTLAECEEKRKIARRWKYDMSLTPTEVEFLSKSTLETLQE